MAPWIPPAVIAFVFWGVWALLPKLAIRHLDPKSALVYQAVGVALVALWLASQLSFRPAWDARGAGIAVLTGMLGFAGSVAYLHALAKGPVAVVAVFTALYPALTVLLAWLFLGESLSGQQILGLVFAAAALVLFSL